MALIEIQGLSFQYQRAKEPALVDFDLRVEEGEFVGVIGPTGAGKTTLCYCLTGVVPHVHGGQWSGRVTVAGQDVRSLEMSRLARTIGFVHQDAESQLLMTDVEKEIVFPLENLGLPREEIRRRLEEILRVVGLEQYRRRHPFYLSGGQRQRVVLAAVLAMNPDVLVLDEATSELDPMGAEEVLSLVGRLNRAGKTVIMVEHNLEALAEHAHRLVVMQKGRKVLEGDTRSVLSNMGLLRDLDLYAPQVTQVAVWHRERGVDIDRVPLTVEEACEIYAARLGVKLA